MEKRLEETYGSRYVLTTAKDYMTEPSSILTIQAVILRFLNKTKGRRYILKRKLSKQIESGLTASDSNLSIY